MTSSNAIIGCDQHRLSGIESEATQPPAHGGGGPVTDQVGSVPPTVGTLPVRTQQAVPQQGAQRGAQVTAFGGADQFGTAEGDICAHDPRVLRSDTARPSPRRGRPRGECLLDLTAPSGLDQRKSRLVEPPFAGQPHHPTASYRRSRSAPRGRSTRNGQLTALAQANAPASARECRSRAIH